MSCKNPFPEKFTDEEWEAEVEESWLQIRRNSLPQVDALLSAGWSFELPEIVNRKEFDRPAGIDHEPWQWYWRSPAKRKGSKGRKYQSTSQAFNALKRQEAK